MVRKVSDERTYADGSGAGRKEVMQITSRRREATLTVAAARRHAAPDGRAAVAGRGAEGEPRADLARRERCRAGGGAAADGGRAVVASADRRP